MKESSVLNEKPFITAAIRADAAFCQPVLCPLVHRRRGEHRPDAGVYH
jgi:hypothetical protein